MTTDRLPVSKSTFFSKESVVQKLYFGFVFALVSTIYLVGPISQYVYPHDSFGLLDGGEKVFRGLRENIDFHSLIGIVPHLITALGVAIEGPVPSAFSTSMALTTLVLAVCTWFLYLRYELNWMSLLIALFICLEWCAPFPIHHRFYQTSYAMVYNREGFALYSLVIVSIIGHHRANGFLLGMLIGTIFFVKLPVAFASLSLILIFMLKNWTVPRMSTLFLGIFAVVVPMLIYIQPQAVLNGLTDIKAAGEIQGMTNYDYRFKVMEVDSLPILFFIPVVWLLFKNTASLKVMLAFELTLVTLGSLFADFGNFPCGICSELPPLTCYGLFLIKRVFECGDALKDWRMWFVGFVMCLFVEGSYVLGIGFTIVDRLYVVPVFSSQLVGNNVIHSEGFEHMRVFGVMGDYPNKTDFADKINDGLTLIKRHPELDKKILATLDFSDCLSVSRQVPSPAQQPLVTDYKLTMDEEHYLAPEFVFKGCYGVMIPKFPDFPVEGPQMLEVKYSNYFKENFAKRDESTFWILLYK